MIDRELMQQALDALCDIIPANANRKEIDRIQHAAITALRERLAQPEQEPVSGQCRFPGVAWSQCDFEHVRMVLDNPHEWKGYEVRYLYTSPQPAQRKPLTDNELADLWYKQSLDWLEFARSIEAAHGIGEKPDAA